MKRYYLNQTVVIDKLDNDFILLLDDKIFQINAYGNYIIKKLCENNISLEQFISNEIKANEDVDSKIINDKIISFINFLLDKNIIYIKEEL